MGGAQIDIILETLCSPVKVYKEFRYHLDLIYVIVLRRRSTYEVTEQLPVCTPARPVRHESQKVFRSSHPAISRQIDTDKTPSAEETHNSSIGERG